MFCFSVSHTGLSRISLLAVYNDSIVIMSRFSSSAILVASPTTILTSSLLTDYKLIELARAMS
jgi:hypothetical protein